MTHSRRIISLHQTCGEQSRSGGLTEHRIDEPKRARSGGLRLERLDSSDGVGGLGWRECQ
jgi:hypothetical protein